MYVCNMQTMRTRASAPEAGAVDSVLHALMSIGRLMRQRLPGDTMDVGTFSLLKHVDANASLRLTDLAACASLDVSTVSRHVAHLHGQGLLERSPDPGDKRAQRVTLSPLGRQRLSEAIARRHALLSRSLAGWEPADIEQLDRLLDRFVSDLENLSSETENV